jgi:hypothetical protein
MSSYAQLQNDVLAWLKRRDIGDRMASWVLQTETDIASVLRARCMIARVKQPIDANFIELPTDWIKFVSVAFDACGCPLKLEDNWTGRPNGGCCQCGATPSPVSAYRIVGDCIEFLPHPTIPTDPTWQPTLVNGVYFAKPKPLIAPTDTNAVLERHYSVYLFSVVRYGAMWGRDDDRESQMTTKLAEAITEANRWLEEANYSGAPLRAVVRSF